ncbi:uncharacterized protein LOC124813352 isoform X3 [Hydra vulgaris]|uniref:uncharacterized protein LOC124813352 isoform X3 n=1 Tax=Hydra vulgaris TaxID=6087 RepID=UPI001F5E4897|nr:uncharacterized protein LOC124813352 isoform X2 [Hydra vulgaris]
MGICSLICLKFGMMNWSIEEVCLHLEQKGFGDLKVKIIDEETDGKALLSLMETMVSNLCVTMRKQVMLLEIIKNLQAPPAQQVTSIATFSAYC